MKSTEIPDAKTFMQHFRREYPYIEHVLGVDEVLTFLMQDHVRNEALGKAMDLFADYLLANDLCEVQE